MPPRRRPLLEIFLVGAAGGITLLVACTAFKPDDPARGVPCTATPLDNIFVAPGGTGNGSNPACPLGTLTAALAAAERATSANGNPTIVHVAPGTYDSAHGEIFPLIVRSQTTLQGEPTADGGALPVVRGGGDWAFAGSTVQATILFGDLGGVPAVKAVRLEPATSGASKSYGVVCDRAPQTSDPQQGMFGVTFAGYDVAILVTSSKDATFPSGCGLKVQSSSIAVGSRGIVAQGLDDSTQVIVTIGSTFDANTFDATGSPNAVGVETKEFVSSIDVTNNVFRGGMGGVRIGATTKPEVVTIAENEFATATAYGVSLAAGLGASVTLSGNTFQGVSAPAGSQTGGAGLVVDYSAASGATTVTATSNTFAGNDVGVLLGGSGAITTAGAAGFGSALFPNDFHCNSALAGAAFLGGDVRVEIGVGAGVTLPFSGNLWDTMPPDVIGMGGAQRNGACVTLTRAPALAIDVSMAAPSSPGCPAGRVP